MSTAIVTSPAGATTGALTLPAEIFDATSNVPLMHQVVVAQLAAARAGTHSTKTRGEVSGGGRKPWRQKGTGRARHGSIRSPQWVGGGIAHGPVPHGHSQRTPKKMKAAALRGALSDRARGGQVHVLSAIVDGEVPSTKAAAATLAAIDTGRNVLVVITRDDIAGAKSLRNVPGVHLLPFDQLNTYDVLRSDDVVFTRAALDAFLTANGAAPATETEVPAGTPAGTGAVKAKKAPAAAKPKTAKADKAEGPQAAKAEEPQKAKAEEPQADEAEQTDEADAGTNVIDETGATDFGPGSHAPLPDDSQPEGYPIKGNASSKLYHVPGSAFYKRTVAEVWFDTPESAEAAGFQLPPSQRKAADAHDEEADQ